MAFSIDRYLARQYDKRHYHCWHLLCEVWLDLTGEDLGAGPPDWDHGAVLARFARYERTATPRSPCVVLMLCPPAVPHVGLFRDGRVLHIRQEGARYDRLEDAVRGFAEVRYYAERHADRESAGTRDMGTGQGPGRARLSDKPLYRMAL